MKEKTNARRHFSLTLPKKREMQDDEYYKTPKLPKSKAHVPMAAAATAAAFALGGWLPAVGVIGAQYVAYKWSKK